MTADQKDNQTFYIILIGLILLHLVLFNSFRIYPFTDLPSHLAEATIYRYSGQPGNQFALYFPYELFPYFNVFHIVFMGCPLFPSVEIGAKVFYSLYIILLPLSIFWLIRELKGDKWFALFSFLYLYNRNFFWGMSAFTFSMPVFFLLFLLILKHLRQDKIILATAVALTFLLLYSIHIITALFAVFVFFALVLSVYWTYPARMLAKGIVTIPLLGMLFIAARSKGDSHLASHLVNLYAKGQGINFGWRLKELLTFDNYFVLPRPFGDCIAIFFSICVLGTIILRFNSGLLRRPKVPLPASLRVMYPLLFCSLFCFLILPYKIPGHGAEYQRFSSFFFLSLIVFGSLGGIMQSTRRVKIGLCSLNLLYFLLWMNCLVAFERQNRGFDQNFFPDDKRGKTLNALLYDSLYGNCPSYLHFPSYYIVWRRGIAATALTKYKYTILNGIASQRKPPYYLEFFTPDDVLTGKDFDADYFLTRGKIYQPHKAIIDKQFTLLKTTGRWSLYKRNNGNAD